MSLRPPPREAPTSDRPPGVEPSARNVSEWLVPFPVARHLVTPATRFRSTWLATSILALRERGLLDRYLAGLPREHHDQVLSSGVGAWLPVEIAVAHYHACDQLALPERDILEIGTAASTRAQRSVVDTASRLSGSAGEGAWAVLAQAHRMWERTWVGGAVAVGRLSKNEARLELAGWPCARIDYCRIAMRGVLHDMVVPSARKLVVDEIPEACGASTLGYHLRW